MNGFEHRTDRGGGTPAANPSAAPPGAEYPCIGITTYLESAKWGVWDRPAALIPENYVSAVFRAGGVPVLLPQLSEGAETALSAVDGLLIAGGADLAPHSYGALAHETVRGIRPERDDWEFRLLKAALARDLPVLGVCRGAQVLNVALGGTLHQHLPEVVGGTEHQPEPGTFGRVPIRASPASKVGAILGARAEVSCHHHQAIDEVGSDLRVTARAADGTVEAVELPDHRFALGVQWHPEEDATDDRLLSALISATRNSGGDR